MRVRKMDANGDRVFGHGLNDFYINDPLGVGQIVRTRLALWTHQWFLNDAEGTDWAQKVLGKYTEGTRDIVIQDRILRTPGVLGIDGYASQLNRDTRVWNVQATINTIWGIFLLKGPI